jgi:hypothetical protein
MALGAPGASAQGATCRPPGLWEIAAAFDRAANGLLPVADPRLPVETHIRAIPPSVLKAVGWVESNWHQFTPQGRPLLSPDFGYGIMQITSGMDGAFGRLHGSIDESSQSAIASDYQFNVAYGARILAQKWAATPRVGNGDSSTVENWYYALWAYNGWGWVNNPNNPRFARLGTPAANPASYPYQERVLYLVSHPPHDSAGNPLWKAVSVSLPRRSLIGSTPHPYSPPTVHHDPPPTSAANYQPARLATSSPDQIQTVSVKIVNTGTQPWLSTGPTQISLTYHLFTTAGNPWTAISPFSAGVVAFGQTPVAIPHDVLPGSSITLRVPVHAPKTAGTYRVVWDLQQGAGTYFSQEGALPRVQIFHVGTSIPAPPATPTPTPQSQTAERMLFVTDTSIPDGSVLAPRQVFEKGWLVFNCGRVSWKGGTALFLVSGSSFGARTIPVPPTAGCKSVDIISTLHAPSRGGSYLSAWRLRDQSGEEFGPRLTVRVTVAGPHRKPTPTPAATPTQTPVPHPQPTGTATPTG